MQPQRHYVVSFLHVFVSMWVPIIPVTAGVLTILQHTNDRIPNFPWAVSCDLTLKKMKGVASYGIAPEYISKSDTTLHLDKASNNASTP